MREDTIIESIFYCNHLRSSSRFFRSSLDFSFAICFSSFRRFKYSNRGVVIFGTPQFAARNVSLYVIRLSWDRVQESTLYAVKFSLGAEVCLWSSTITGGLLLCLGLVASVWHEPFYIDFPFTGWVKKKKKKPGKCIIPHRFKRFLSDLHFTR